MNSLARAGRVFFSACGMMIYHMVCTKLSPRLRPASLCPLSTDIIPARIISATYAPELMPKHSIATGTPFRAEVKMTKNMMSSWIITGVPRITVKYTLQMALAIFSRVRPKPGRISWIFLSWALRTMATMEPMAIPISTATSAIFRVFPRPRVM